MRATVLSLIALFVLACTVSAQSPIPVIVQAATPATASSKTPAATSDNSASLQAALKMLQEMKAANEETLRKQAATLEQLDALEKAAEQIKIYTKRS